MRAVIFFLVLYIIPVTAPVSAQAVDAEAVVTEAEAVIAEIEESVSTSEPSEVSAETQSTGLPDRVPQARTMRAYWHVFIAFAATWVLLFGYALTMGRRFGQLEDEVRRLRESSPP